MEESFRLKRVKPIRIFNGCEVLIENSVTRVTVRHHEQLPEWRNFQFAPNNHYGFFFLHTLPSTITFRLEYVFYQFYAKITTFFDKENFGAVSLLYVDVETFGRNWRQNVKNDVKTSYRSHARDSSYTPHVRRHFLAPVGFTEIPVGYARKTVLVCMFSKQWLRPIFTKCFVLANSEDPNQTPRSAAFDLGLYCLSRFKS